MMTWNGAQVHLLVNHAPVLAYPFVVIAMLWGLWRKEEAVQTFASYLALAATIATAAAQLTGEGAEHVLKELGQAPRDLIHAHEESGEKALIASIAIGLLAVLTLPLVRPLLGKIGQANFQSRLRLLLLVLCAALSAWLGYTAHQGGLIRHPEIRGVQAP